jgi:hypothetical protein
MVGDDTGIKLEVIGSDLITLKQFSENHPNGKVLSRDTGHNRSYNNSPYSGYEESAGLIFPIKFENTALFAKEIMFVFNADENTPIALKRADITETNQSINVGGRAFNFSMNNGSINVTDPNRNQIPGYHEMWFSFATQHPENGIYWTAETGLVQ